MNPDIVTDLDKMPQLSATQSLLSQGFSIAHRTAKESQRSISASDVESLLPFFKPSDSKMFLDDVLHIEKLLWKEPSESESKTTDQSVS